MSENKCVNYLTKGAKRLDLELNSVESCVLEQNNRKKHLDRESYTLIFVVDGTCLLEYKDKKITAKSGTCAFVVPKEQTSVSCLGQEPAVFYKICFSGIDVIKVLDVCRLKNQNNDLYFSLDKLKVESVKRYLDRMLRFEETGGQAEYVMALGYFYLLIYELIDKKETALVFDKNSTSLWRSVCDYISANYDMPVSVDVLAEKLNIHRTTLYRLFKKYSGMSPVEYVLDFRLQKAYFLVVNTKNLYVDIAFKCGFNDVAYFYRLFKRKYQKTPRQVREDSCKG